MTCQKLELTKLVKIKTGDCLNLTPLSATLTGELVDAGEEGVLDYGICWSTSPNPTPGNSSHLSWGWTADSQHFQTDIIGLTWNTSYYFRSYCTVIASEYIYGEEKTFTTPYDAKFLQLPVGVEPVIDGVIDGIWNNVEKHYIDRNFYGSSPTIDSAYWKGAWNASALFILVAVYDDVHIDQFDLGDDVNWYADKPEIYIDVNSTLKDGLGPSEGSLENPTNPYGHYQFAPSWWLNTNGVSTNEISWQNAFYYWGYQLQEPDYVFEYAIKWNGMKDINGVVFDPLINNREFGFDVTITDRDYIAVPRSFKVWRNAGGPVFDDTFDYFNMDGAGVAVLKKDIIKYP